MSYKLRFHELALGEWHKLNSTLREQFKKKLTERLEHPRVPAAALSCMADCYKIKLRKAGYRLVYRVEAWDTSRPRPCSASTASLHWDNLGADIALTVRRQHRYKLRPTTSWPYCYAAGSGIPAISKAMVLYGKQSLC